jgi:hypothetical protein
MNNGFQNNENMGGTGGTSIAQLRQRASLANNNNNDQYDENHQYNSDNKSTNSYKSNSDGDGDGDGDDNSLTIENLVTDINSSFDDFSPSDEQETKSELDTDSNDEDEKLYSNIVNIAKDPVVLLILYVILSQDSVKSFFGTYIKQINPQDDGSVSFMGIVIYGLILAVLFVIVRQLIIK